MSDVQSDILKRTISANSLAKTNSQISVRSSENAMTAENISETARSKSFEDLKHKDVKEVLENNSKENSKGHKKKGANNKKDDDCDADSEKDTESPHSEGTLSGADNSANDQTLEALDSVSMSGCSADSGSSKSYLSTSPQGSSPDDPSVWILEAFIETDYSDVVLKKVADFEVCSCLL